LITGYDLEKKYFVVNDPYGVRQGAADLYNTSVSGEKDIYSFNLMNQIFFDLDPSYGKGRIVTAINGKSTGLNPVK
jgi:hypothetical protein